MIVWSDKFGTSRDIFLLDGQITDKGVVFNTRSRLLVPQVVLAFVFRNLKIICPSQGKGDDINPVVSLAKYNG